MTGFGNWKKVEPELALHRDGGNTDDDWPFPPTGVAP